MSVCVYSVFVLFCVYVAALRRSEPPFKESYRLYKEKETNNKGLYSHNNNNNNNNNNKIMEPG
jgi:hypothetical protein